MEKQILYVRVNENITSRVVLDSPVNIKELIKKLDTIDRINESGIQTQGQEEQGI